MRTVLVLQTHKSESTTALVIPHITAWWFNSYERETIVVSGDRHHSLQGDVTATLAEAVEAFWKNGGTR